MKTDRTTIKRFFDLLWPDDVPEGTRLCVWTLAGRRATWCASVDEATSAAAASTRDVYAGGGLGLPGLQAGERVRKDTAQGICGLWADIDYSDEVHKKSPYLPPSEADAVELLRMLPHAPTLIHFKEGRRSWLGRRQRLRLVARHAHTWHRQRKGKPGSACPYPRRQGAALQPQRF
jgi:hypothetical protein